MHGLNLQPLSPVIGAEVGGLDLRKELSGADLAAVLDAFATFHLLLFRGQEIIPKQQRRFIEYFGPLRDRARLKTEDGHIFISNRVDGGAVGDGELAFHSDHSFVERPDTGVILLYALAVPSSGGETLFANTLKAYDDLSGGLKKRITGLHALHVLGTLGIPRGTRARAEDIEPRYRAVQPLVWKQHDTGKSVLYVNQYVNHIVELDQEDGDKLLAELEAHLYREELLYKHKWRVGDVVVWNNRILQHARNTFDPSEARTLRKSSVGEPELITEDGLVAEAG